MDVILGSGCPEGNTTLGAASCSAFSHRMEQCEIEFSCEEKIFRGVGAFLQGVLRFLGVFVVVNRGEFVGDSW
jgi:hypothetical protein